MGQAAAKACSGSSPAAPPLPCSSSIRSGGSQKKISPSGSLEQVTSPRRVRSTGLALYLLGCAERHYDDDEKRRPVKLVIFDLDETLTLTTFMSGDGEYEVHQAEMARQVNFETPWVEGSRIEKLQKMFQDLRMGKRGQRRTLAVLTRNSNPGGVNAVLNLLKAADLARFFSAIWTMPWRPHKPNGVYQEAGEWKTFFSPVHKVVDHKAHVLRNMAQQPEKWFPQLEREEAADVEVRHLSKLRPENIVLVDDQRANFQSDAGVKVIRYCKPARYNAEYYDFGLLKGMGGIGAHDDRDYVMLTRFVEEPWAFKESPEIRCVEMKFEGSEHRPPVSLVVFSFDETLTLASFLPSDGDAFSTQVGWTPSETDEEGWTEELLVEYNFESPFVKNSRVAKLREMLKQLADGDVQDRTLAIMSRGTSAIGILNLLRMAELAGHFSAIWTICAESRSAVYQDASGQWKSFETPGVELGEDKADVLRLLAEDTPAWFPQLAGQEQGRHRHLVDLTPAGIVLVDNEAANFWSGKASQAVVLRQAKVWRYDDEYRDCGFMNELGGIGAHCEKDYEKLIRFVEAPWDFSTAVGPRASPMGGELLPAGRSIKRKLTTQEVMQTVPTMKREEASQEETPGRKPRRRTSATMAPIKADSEFDFGD